jgi:uncharacterized membrane protein HdeD (DUF308 family)
MEVFMSATSVVTIARRSLNWSIIFSILMILAGVAAIAMPPVAGLAVSIVVTWLLLFSGAMHLVFAWHTRTVGAATWEALLGLVYGTIAIYLLAQPVAGLVALTLALAIYLFLEAVLEFTAWGFLRRLPGAGWLLFDGVVTLILAVMIWRTWPSSTEWVIGTLVGVSMLFSGASRLMLSLAARQLVPKNA